MNGFVFTKGMLTDLALDSSCSPCSCGLEVS